MVLHHVLYTLRGIVRRDHWRRVHAAGREDPHLPLTVAKEIFAGVGQEVHIGGMTSDLDFVLHSVRTLHFQKLVDRVAEDAGARQLQRALDLPGVALPDQLQTAKEHRVAWSRCDEPLLKLLGAGKLDLSSLPFRKAMTEFIANYHVGCLWKFVLIDWLFTCDIHISIVATLVPQDEIAEDIGALNGLQTFPNGPNDLGRCLLRQLGNLSVIPKFVLALRILVFPSLCPLRFLLLEGMRLGRLVDDARNGCATPFLQCMLEVKATHHTTGASKIGLQHCVALVRHCCAAGGGKGEGKEKHRRHC
mmetsp:Transcript_64625/g.131389  ORF Transcript_64625/g.131389 Transcript_64625/m.131389 type:complete len:304 (-) Transcript_64625:47-958(-)